MEAYFLIKVVVEEMNFLLIYLLPEKLNIRVYTSQQESI